jgi:hypothetical protein
MITKVVGISQKEGLWSGVWRIACILDTLYPYHYGTVEKHIVEREGGHTEVQKQFKRQMRREKASFKVVKGERGKGAGRQALS